MAKPVEMLNTEKLTNEWVKRYERLVYFVAHQFKSSSIEWDDLVQIGYVGLLKAANTFDPYQGNQFQTYAVSRIRGEILNELKYLKKYSKEVSLDAPVGVNDNDEDITLLDRLVSEGDLEDKVLNKTVVQAIMEKLSERECEIIQLRYGLRDGISRRVSEIAEIMGVTTKLIFATERKIVWKLRRLMNQD